ncbi:hypothetical protein G3580_08160 [Nitrogeniibacter mangrovi]|uniref:Uncharacterized protein n=1 Tax=Nitrogeniibacter mangrovi TaxID=2016596 RepID=A0A6C1B3Q2_9RHOO|nr:hypothetical protein [Nitrogeniibacter mangrovi]QID17619.1 hypothetical protein G3580_08160 [Nitrogeniibacter mangrovi]
MTRIVIHIDALVLQGIDRRDADAVAAGVRAELARRLADPAAANTLGTDTRRVDAGRVHTGTTAGRSLGGALAGPILRGLAR